MTFDTANLQAQFSHHATTAASYVQYGRDETLAFLSNNLPTVVTEKVTTTAQFINDSLVAKNLESLVGTTPSVATSAVLGAAAGSLFVFGRPLSAMACLLPAIGFTKDTADISILGISFITGAAASGISLFGRAKNVSDAI